MDPEGRRATLTPVAEGITSIDTFMTGEPELNAVYLVASTEPTLVEAGPGADHAVIVDALARLGIDRTDLAHIVVTHIHLDHAGGAGRLVGTFPNATVWAHERGVPHLADPTRLVASTARTYGTERMEAYFGSTAPVPAERLRPLSDGDEIPLGDRTLRVITTPGHASHHIALLEPSSGAIFTGEAIGSHLPWADCFRPALPPPDVDVERALESIERIRETSPTVMLTSHFGPVIDVPEGCDRAARRIHDWSRTVHDALRTDPAIERMELRRLLVTQASKEFLDDSGRPIDLARYDVLGSIAMNVDGLSRYWRKRWDREAIEDAAATEPGPDG